jgi:hypothetical protein
MQSDTRYQSTKQIMLGNEQMNPDFKPLAGFINTEFEVSVVNMFYGYPKAKGDTTLDIWFEFEREMRNFNEAPERRFSLFDEKKQKIIAGKFGHLVDKKRYDTENIWVIYSDFESGAKAEANESVSEKELRKLKKQLDNRDIWNIVTDFASVTFYLYTDKKVKFYENSPIKKEWADKYFDILNKYNEFGYFKRDIFDIYLDSKKNFVG